MIFDNKKRATLDAEQHRVNYGAMSVVYHVLLLDGSNFEVSIDVSRITFSYFRYQAHLCRKELQLVRIYILSVRIMVIIYMISMISYRRDY